MSRQGSGPTAAPSRARRRASPADGRDVCEGKLSSNRERNVFFLDSVVFENRGKGRGIGLSI